MDRRSASPYRTKPRFKLQLARESIRSAEPARNHSYHCNHEPPPAPYSRAEVMAARIDRLDPTFHLHIVCHCRKHTIYPLRLLMMRHGRTTTLAENVERLRCKECRRRPGDRASWGDRAP